MTRPPIYTQEQAAARMGVSRRTVRDWCARKDRDGRPWLTPVPGSRELLGYPLYTGPDLVHAERLAKAGRRVRRTALAR